MMRAIILCLLFFCAISEAEQRVEIGVDVVSSSESVPILDMINGWKDDYRSGELAFLDAEWFVSYRTDLVFQDRLLGQIDARKKNRHYYYLLFDEDTSEFYRLLGNGGQLGRDLTLDLEAKSFDAYGYSLSYMSPWFDMSSSKVKFEVEYSRYQIRNFQFADVDGVASLGDKAEAAAIINYRYDKDKILSCPEGNPLLPCPGDVDQGKGGSVSFGVKVDGVNWLFSWHAKDIYNQFFWRNGASTIGCVNIGGGESINCQDALEKNIYVAGQGRVLASIPATHSLSSTYKRQNITLSFLKHDAFRQVGVEKGLQTPVGRLGFFLYDPKLFGMSWQIGATSAGPKGEGVPVLGVRIASDTLSYQDARNFEFNMTARWPW